MRQVFAGLMFVLGVAGKLLPGGAGSLGKLWSMCIVISCRARRWPRHIELSIAMAESAISDGITHVVATPHSSNEYFLTIRACESCERNCKQKIGDRLVLATGL